MSYPGIEAITCDNPSPMTLDGTTSYLVTPSGTQSAIIIDPGPDAHPEHLERIRKHLGIRDVALILITHRHADHTGAAALFSAEFNAPVRAADPAHCRTPGTSSHKHAVLTDGEWLGTNAAVQVVATPGHTSDSVCFWFPEQSALFSGDTLLGAGSTMLDYPDGTLTDYLNSLERLTQFTDAQLFPAHGPQGRALGTTAQTAIEHRLQRLEQARKVIEAEPQIGPEGLGRRLYPDPTPVGQDIITKIAAAQLAHLKNSIPRRAS